MFETYYIDDLFEDKFLQGQYFFESDVPFWPTSDVVIGQYEFLQDNTLRYSVRQYIIDNFRDRELCIPERILSKEAENFIDDIIVPYVTFEINTIFNKNAPSWQRMYDALNEEYNPLWNVDGKETRSYVKENSGTQSNDVTKTGSVSDNLTYTGSESNNNTKGGSYTDNIVYKGTHTSTETPYGQEVLEDTKEGKEEHMFEILGTKTEKTEHSKDEKTVYDGNKTMSKTPYDSNEALLSTKEGYDEYSTEIKTLDNENAERPEDKSKNFDKTTTQYSNGYNEKTTTTYGDASQPIFVPMKEKHTKYYEEKDEEQYRIETKDSYGTGNDERKDERTVSYTNLTDNTTKSFTNRADNRSTTYDNVKDAGLRTDNLKEEYEETYERGGNIGVTKSQELLESEVLVRMKYNMTELIANELVDGITYLC